MPGSTLCLCPQLPEEEGANTEGPGLRSAEWLVEFGVAVTFLANACDVLACPVAESMLEIKSR